MRRQIKSELIRRVLSKNAVLFLREIRMNHFGKVLIYPCGCGYNNLYYDFAKNTDGQINI